MKDNCDIYSEVLKRLRTSWTNSTRQHSVRMMASY